MWIVAAVCCTADVQSPIRSGEVHVDLTSFSKADPVYSGQEVGRTLHPKWQVSRNPNNRAGYARLESNLNPGRKCEVMKYPGLAGAISQTQLSKAWKGHDVSGGGVVDEWSMIGDRYFF